MPVNLLKTETIYPVKGIRLSGLAAGIKKNGKKDLALIEISDGASVAAVFTQNKLCAAPVTVAKQHLEQLSPCYLLINSGNANAGTGEQGVLDAKRSCQIIADVFSSNEKSVLPFSTGVICEPLFVEKIDLAAAQLKSQLSENGWQDASTAILTTDTVEKVFSQQFDIAGETITITGMAKGSGMIHPNMATLLSFITTDVAIASPLLERMIQRLSGISFNSITVDGDTSTNDACVLIATGASNVKMSNEDDVAYAAVFSALKKAFLYLAQAIIRDAEGATKFVTLQVDAAKSEAAARQVAYTVALSPLVKTALFASDPNWGRILAAIGRSGISDLVIEDIEIILGHVPLVLKAGIHPDYKEADAQAVMNEEEITIRIVLNQGDSSATVWTSDLSYDYVRINAEYRT
ncbi:MAG: bifunctional glutamate N-acetyltransferase/amino-acid acetyltransferase ArgJ [Gammaproteobacteria bacterium]|nr:bifunctional glutamate N-acetyltransferase/amino-acid acetyltransferase ArgJ [Gammaproteobacteria bacterium]